MLNEILADCKMAVTVLGVVFVILLPVIYFYLYTEMYEKPMKGRVKGASGERRKAKGQVRKTGIKISR